jgi:hypothetical protein
VHSSWNFFINTITFDKSSQKSVMPVSKLNFRSMRGDEAKRVCPDIQLVQVPVARGKADLNLYRSAGSEVSSTNTT